MSPFGGKNIQRQYNVLNQRIDLYFHDYKIETEIDENEHSDRNMKYKIKRQKALEQRRLQNYDDDYQADQFDVTTCDIIFLLGIGPIHIRLKKMQCLAGFNIFKITSRQCFFPLISLVYIRINGPPTFSAEGIKNWQDH